MRANGQVVRGYEIPNFSNILGAVKEWAREHVTQDKIAERCLVAGSFALWGYLILALHHAIQTRTVVGF